MYRCYLFARDIRGKVHPVRPAEALSLSGRDESAKSFQHVLNSSASPIGSSAGEGGKLLHIEVLHVNAMRFYVTFNADASTHTDRIIENTGMLAPMLSAVGIALVNVKRAPLCVDAIVLSNPCASMAELRRFVSTRIKEQLIYESYRILGCSELLGNPSNVVSAFGGGAYSFFNEPIQGIVKGPGDFVEGVGKGAGALLSGMVRGFGTFTGGLASSASKTMRYVIDDDDYHRRRASNAQRAENLADGIAQGASGFLGGIADGISGIVTAPVDGADTGGFGGLYSRSRQRPCGRSCQACCGRV